MKTFALNAPKSMSLHKMSEAEITEYVEKQSEKMLDAIPDGLRAVGVNTVSLSQSLDPTVWAQWTRACCAQRKKIDEFVDPVVLDYGFDGAVGVSKIANAHAESQMRVIMLQSPRHVK